VTPRCCGRWWRARRCIEQSEGPERPGGQAVAPYCLVPRQCRDLTRDRPRFSTWEPTLASFPSYTPGDRVCWLIHTSTASFPPGASRPTVPGGFIPLSLLPARSHTQPRLPRQVRRRLKAPIPALIAFQHDQVTFRWKDYAHVNKKRMMTLSSQEFLRRFLLHVQPRGNRIVLSHNISRRLEDTVGRTNGQISDLRRKNAVAKERRTDNSDLGPELLIASAGLVRLRGKRAQKFGSHERTLRLGRDWPVMAIFRQQSLVEVDQLHGLH
jgi:hypothetical protein